MAPPRVSGAALGAETGAADDEHLGPIQEPVEARGGQQRVEEQIGPLIGSAVGGQQDAAVLVALVDDIVQIFWAGLLKRLEAEVIQDQQIRTQVERDPPFPGPIRPAAVEVLEHFLGVDEQHIQTLAGPHSWPRAWREVRFAYSGRAADQQIAFLADKLTGGQVAGPAGG